LLNVAGYYDALIAFLAHSVAEQFVRPESASLLLVDSAPESLLERFAAYAPPPVAKWLGRSEI